MKNKLFPYIAIFVVWLLFSSPFFFSGKSPFPSDYQNNFFAPWNVYPGHSGPVKNNAQPDIITQIYPWRHFDIQEYKKGVIPFWNPFSFAGTPHLANYQSAALSPFNLLFFLPLDFLDIWSFLVLLQPLLAGVCMFQLCRKLKVSKAGSILSSYSFMFCGFLVTWMGYATLGYAILFLPLAYYSILQYVSSRSLRWLIILAITFPISFFSGHFQMSVYFSLGVFLFIFYNLLFSNERKLFATALLFSIFGIFLTMPQVLPSIEFYSLSPRSNLFQKIEAIPWNYLPTLLSPDFYGNPVTRNDWFGHYAEWSGFSGLVAFVFSLAAVILKRNRVTLFFIVLAVVSLLLAYDTPLLTFLVNLKLPVLSTSAASRIIVLFSFSIAVLSGIGFDEVVSVYKKDKRKILLWFVVSLVPVIVVSIIPFLHLLDIEKSHIAQKNIVLPIALFGIIGIATLILLVVKHKYSKLFFICCVLAASSFEMYRFAAKWQSFTPKKEAYIPVSISKFYGKQNSYDRLIGLSGGEDAVYYRMPILSGYDPLYSVDYGKFVQYVGSGSYKNPERSVVNFPLDGRYTPQALNFLGVKFIVRKDSDGEMVWAFPFKKYRPEQFTKIYDDASYDVFLNKNSFNRAYLVSNVVRVDEKVKDNATLFDYDLSKTAIVYDDVRGLSDKASGSVKILKYSSSRIELEAQTTGASFLVVTDNYYPGWKAFVNGKEVKIYKADYAFRGIVIPAGRSTITFSFVPQSFLIGTYLFFIGIMGMVVYYIIRKFKYLS